MKITLKKIAEDTGYSVSTVSRVLNGSNKISTKTRNRILESARKHEYRLPRVKNANSSKQVLNIALLAADFHVGEFYASFFKGLNTAAKKDNVRLFLSGINYDKKEIINLMKDITYLYDGVILFVPKFNRNDYLELNDVIPSKFPIVSNVPIENPLFPTITFNNYSGGHLAATHFEEKGYKRVGVIKGLAEKAEARFRFNGFSDYINNQVNMELIWIYNGDFTFEGGHNAFEEFDKLSDKPDAIFACNDAMCNGFMEAALEKNYQFPSDIAIMGYDDLPMCQHNRPTMSSIHTDYEQLGAATIKLMRDRLSNADQQEQAPLRFVPVTLCEREST